MSAAREVIERIAFSLLRGLPAEAPGLLGDDGLHRLLHLPAEEVTRATGGARGMARDLARRGEALQRAAAEYEYATAHGIRCLSAADPDWPDGLRDIADAPRMLYILGKGSLTAKRMLSVVGTRRATAYGTAMTRRLIEALSERCAPVSIVSGLAYGIDCAAHTAALETGMPTLAIVAHGLGMIYPSAHRDLAHRIIEAGGAIVSEYLHDTRPWRGQFLERNRIVAAISAVTLVAETPVKGGALSTASCADSYGRAVLAVPGRVGDEASAGCNHLIRSRRAEICTSAGDIIETAGWSDTGLRQAAPAQMSLFEPMGDEKLVADCLRGSAEPVQFDIIAQRTGIAVPALLALLAEMEFDGHLLRYPGNRFALG